MYILNQIKVHNNYECNFLFQQFYHLPPIKFSEFKILLTSFESLGSISPKKSSSFISPSPRPLANRVYMYTYKYVKEGWKFLFTTRVQKVRLSTKISVSKISFSRIFSQFLDAPLTYVSFLIPAFYRGFSVSVFFSWLFDRKTPELSRVRPRAPETRFLSFFSRTCYIRFILYRV